MTNTPKFFYRGPLATSPTALFTCATGSTIIITNIVLVNKDSVSNTATLAMAGLTLVPSVTLAPATILPLDIRQVMTAGFNFVGYSSSSGNQVIAHISGVEQT